MQKLMSSILLLSSFFSFSQEKVNLYFDENNKQVNILDYFKKCSSFLYTCNKQKLDSVILNTTFELYKFGKLTKIETLQVQKLLAKSTDRKKLKNGTIIISFRDLIYGQEEQKTLNDTISFDRHNFYTQSKSKYISRRKRYDINQKKCLNKLKKQNISPLYLYKINKGYNYVSKNIKWHKVHPVIDKYFFKYKYPMMLILKTNGNYFRYLSLSENAVENLLKNEWTSYIKDYQIAKVNLLKNRNGFFNTININREKRTFYIDNRFINDGTRKKVPKSLPNNTIVVRNRSEIRNYLSKQVRCYSRANF